MKKKDKKCPKCGATLRTVWTKGRKLVDQCPESADYGEPYCDWESKPYTPKKRPIRTVKTISTDQGGWEFEAFDQYGHTFIYSQGYDSERECRQEAKKAIDRASKDPDMGKCVAIIWPPTTKVKGKLIK